MNKPNISLSYFQIMAKMCITLIAGISSSLLLSSPIHAATIGHNLIVNGDAEQGIGDGVGNAVGADIPTIPGWTLTNSFSVLKYGATGFSFINPFNDVVTVSGLPDTSSPGPSDRAKNLFYGGGDRKFSSASQLINVAEIASIIDGSQGVFTLSGWLGGYTNDPDSALLEISFFNQDQQSLGKANIASPTPQQRSNTTGLFFQSVDGFVPVGTRQISVLLNMNYAKGRVNDAYADSLSLVIKKVPEPSISGLVLVGVSSVMVWKLRKNS